MYVNVNKIYMKVKKYTSNKGKGKYSPVTRKNGKRDYRIPVAKAEHPKQGLEAKERRRDGPKQTYIKGK